MKEEHAGTSQSTCGASGDSLTLAATDRKVGAHLPANGGSARAQRLFSTLLLGLNKIIGNASNATSCSMVEVLSLKG